MSPKTLEALARKVDKQMEAKARKLYVAFMESLQLKRTWDRLAPTEQDAWRAVAAVD